MITRQQVNHVSRLVNQVISKPDFSIIGGYHGVNLGDIALGESVRLILKEMDYKGGLQTIYNIDKWPWPDTKFSIIGGGAVGYTDSLIKLKAKVKSDYSKMAFLGVDFNELKYNDEVLSMLKGAAWISCRNEFQASKLKQITGRSEISFHPDLVFSYRTEVCDKLRKKPKEKKLLINVVPLYGKLVNGEFLPNQSYKEERPELFENYDRLIKGYTTGLHDIVNKHLTDGFTIETVPFTPGDEEVAKHFLRGLPVKHNSYIDDVDKMLYKIGGAQRIFATRYHATILGIKTGAEVIPMAYATKNEKLLNELGVKSESFISSTDLAKGLHNFPEPLTIDHTVVARWEAASAASIKNCVNALINKNSV